MPKVLYDNAAASLSSMPIPLSKLDYITKCAFLHIKREKRDRCDNRVTEREVCGKVKLNRSKSKEVRLIKYFTLSEIQITGWSKWILHWKLKYLSI